jgi:hypothetical protein
MMLRVATVDDLDLVLEVLDDAAAWLWRRGVRQWPERFRRQWVLPALRRGETWLVGPVTRPDATFTLSWEDAAWPDARDGDAGYVHRFAVRRSAAGIGADVLGRIRALVLEAGCEFVRLDCVAANADLRAYYQHAGFRHRGDVDVRGAPGQRLVGGDSSVTVSRYELTLGG